MKLLSLSQFKNTIWLTAITITTVIALSDVNTDCIASNNGTISNDFLLGTWYKIYKFIHLGPYPTCSCPNVTFSRPTEEELRGYREKFRPIDLPHEIGDDAVVADRGYIKGLVLGGAETKTYIIDPKSVIRSNEEGYEVHVFRRISDKYMLWWQCSLRGHEKWLLTRDRHAPEVEMKKIIWERPEVAHKENGVRYCNVTCYR